MFVSQYRNAEKFKCTIEKNYQSMDEDMNMKKSNSMNSCILTDKGHSAQIHETHDLILACHDILTKLLMRHTNIDKAYHK